MIIAKCNIVNNMNKSYNCIIVLYWSCMNNTFLKYLNYDTKDCDKDFSYLFFSIWQIIRVHFMHTCMSCSEVRVSCAVPFCTENGHELADQTFKLLLRQKRLNWNLKYAHKVYCLHQTRTFKQIYIFYIKKKLVWWWIIILLVLIRFYLLFDILIYQEIPHKIQQYFQTKITKVQH